MITIKFSIWFWDEKNFMAWTHPATANLWPFFYGHSGIFCGDSPRQKSSIWSFFCSAMVYVCFKRKTPECIMGSRDSTGIWSWPILMILTEIIIFGRRFLSNHKFTSLLSLDGFKPWNFFHLKIIYRLLLWSFWSVSQLMKFKTDDFRTLLVFWSKSSLFRLWPLLKPWIVVQKK